MYRFGGTYTKIGTIQRRLAWPLRKDDTQNREAFHIFVLFENLLIKLIWFKFLRVNYLEFNSNIWFSSRVGSNYSFIGKIFIVIFVGLVNMSTIIPKWQVQL